MLYEYAIMPELFDVATLSTQPEKTIVVELMRGIIENGLIANLHKDRWLEYVYNEKLISLDQPTKDMILTLFTVLANRNRIVRYPGSQAHSTTGSIDWLEIAMLSHRQMPFHAIIKENSISRISCNEIIDISSLLSSTLWTDRRRTFDLTKTRANYLSILEKTIRHAKLLYLIDPFLNSNESRYTDTISLAATLLGKRMWGNLHGRIHIHADFSKQQPAGLSLSEHLNRWGTILQPLHLSSGHEFRVYLWQSIYGSETLHDRYILTEQCGISTQAGLDCRSSSHANSTTWCLLDENSRQLRIQNYETATTPFDLLGHIIIQNNAIQIHIK